MSSLLSLLSNWFILIIPIFHFGSGECWELVNNINFCCCHWRVKLSWLLWCILTESSRPLQRIILPASFLDQRGDSTSHEQKPRIVSLKVISWEKYIMEVEPDGFLLFLFCSFCDCVSRLWWCALCFLFTLNGQTVTITETGSCCHS